MLMIHEPAFLYVRSYLTSSELLTARCGPGQLQIRPDTFPGQMM